MAVCDLTIKAAGRENSGILRIKLGDAQAEANVSTVLPEGAGIKIRLEDKSFGNQRSLWRQNVLEIAARHPALGRYLGPKAENFPGQETKHFRVILAEIVTDAVCAKLIGQNIQSRPEEFEEADWDDYYPSTRS